MRNRQLNPRQQAFIKHYLEGQNATQAAIKAGYKALNAAVVGSKLLRHKKIKGILEKKFKPIEDRLEMSAENVLRELWLVGRSNIADFTRLEGNKRIIDLSTATRDQLAAVSEITEDATGGTGDGKREVVLRTRLKLHDKISALEATGRHFKLFTEKHEVSAVQAMPDDELERRMNDLLEKALDSRPLALRKHTEAKLLKAKDDGG